VILFYASGGHMSNAFFVQGVSLTA